MKFTKNFYTRLIISVAVLTCNSIAIADPIDDFELSCCEQNTTTIGAMQCTQKATVMWDKAMNVEYDSLMKRLPRSGQQTLLSAQLAWLAYRDKEFANIDTVTGSQQGTLYVNVAAGQKRETVKQRVLQLRSYNDKWGN